MFPIYARVWNRKNTWPNNPQHWEPLTLAFVWSCRHHGSGYVCCNPNTKELMRHARNTLPFSYQPYIDNTMHLPDRRNRRTHNIAPTESTFLHSCVSTGCARVLGRQHLCVHLSCTRQSQSYALACKTSPVWVGRCHMSYSEDRRGTKTEMWAQRQCHQGPSTYLDWKTSHFPPAMQASSVFAH